MIDSTEDTSQNKTTCSIFSNSVITMQRVTKHNNKTTKMKKHRKEQPHAKNKQHQNHSL